MVSAFMISRGRLATLFLLPAALLLIEASCSRVPLLAPSGSSITLTSATSVLPIDGTATITAQVIQSSGTAPQAGTHVTFTTTLGTVQPSEVTTNSAGQATATFTSTASGTASISAISGGASTAAASPLKILVGTAAVQKVVVNASPATIPALGGTSTVSAVVFDVNGNLMTGVPVTFTTTAGTLSVGVATTDANGTATSVITTTVAATVTASVGVGTTTTTPTPTTGTTPTTPTTPSASGTASGSVAISIAAAPTLVITPPTTPPSAGLPASFTFAITVAATNGSAVKAVTVDWGDGNSQELGAVTGNAVVAHVYANAGSYAVKAAVTDASGNTVSVSTVVTVITAASPTIIITPTVPTTHGTSGTVVSFQVQVTVPTGIGVTSVTINFGDQVTSSLGGLNGTATIQHTYAAAGPETITVTVIDTLNRTTTGQTSISVP